MLTNSRSHFPLSRLYFDLNLYRFWIMKRQSTEYTNLWNGLWKYWSINTPTLTHEAYSICMNEFTSTHLFKNQMEAVLIGMRGSGGRNSPFCSLWNRHLIGRIEICGSNLKLLSYILHVNWKTNLWIKIHHKLISNNKLFQNSISTDIRIQVII